MADVFVVGPRLAYTDGGCKFGRRPSWRCALFLYVDDTLCLRWREKAYGMCTKIFHLVILSVAQIVLWIGSGGPKVRMFSKVPAPVSASFIQR